MYVESSISKRFVLIPILVVAATQRFFMRSVSSLNLTNAYLHHKCLTNYGKYKPGSQHEKFLNFIIHRFSKNKEYFQIGYGMMSMGNQPDKVSVTFQCRGDSFGPKCHSCFATAQSELKKRCLRDKGGIIWYDQCFVEFSSIDTYGKLNYDDGLCIPSAKNSSHDDFPFVWLTLYSNLTEVIIHKNSSDHYYAAGEKRFQNQKAYVMVQCVKDLTMKDCDACMTYMAVNLSRCAFSQQGARVFLGRSCNYRVELYPFINPKSPNYYTKF